jgi:hypothetical protein
VPQYGRPQLGLPRLSAVVKKLLFVLLFAYVAQLVLDGWLEVPIVALLAMRPGGLALWQLVTYVLVDLGHPLMFLIGLLFLWWALSPFEIGYGPRRTLQLVATAILSASVPAYLLGLIIAPAPPLYGSSPIWFAALAATTWLHRDRQIALFGAMQMSARQFLWLLLGISVLMFLATKNQTQFIADLGAISGGVGFVQWMKRPRRAPSSKSKPKTRGFKVIQGGNDDDRPKWLN